MLCPKWNLPVDADRFTEAQVVHLRHIWSPLVAISACL